MSNHNIHTHPLSAFRADHGVLSPFSRQLQGDAAVGTSAVACGTEILDPILEENKLRLHGTENLQKDFILTATLGVVSGHGTKERKDQKNPGNDSDDHGRNKAVYGKQDKIQHKHKGVQLVHAVSSVHESSNSGSQSVHGIPRFGHIPSDTPSYF